MTVMLWPYRPLLVVLLVLLRYRSLWLGERYCNNGFLVNNEPLQCDYLP